MEKNRKSILDLNDYCKLKIVKYIIADCELDGKSKSDKMNYMDLVSFALAHENLEAVLEEYYNDLYKSLEFLLVENRSHINIDFAELLSKYTGKAGDVFWRYLANAIRGNSTVDSVRLSFRPESYQPEFLDIFQMIKCAFENKRRLNYVDIDLNGYSLDDLNNFGNIVFLDLNVRMSAEALVSVCKSNSQLQRIMFMSTEIQGRLSDIFPHCRNLLDLQFLAKPDVDLAEYAPLALLPKLQFMTIHGAFQNGSMLTMFEAVQKWHGPETNNVTISFCDELPHLSTVTIVRNNSFHSLEIYEHKQGTRIKTSYKFMKISKDTSPLEQSLVTISLIVRYMRIESTEPTFSTCPTSDADISEFSSLLKQFNVETLTLSRNEDYKPLGKILASISEELISLKSLTIKGVDMDHLDTRELVKIKSIKSLKCSFSDWESVELLSALTNLEAVDITVEKKFDKTSSKALCNLLNTCQVSGNIRCENFDIKYMQQNKVLGQIDTVSIFRVSNMKSLYELLEALANRDLITIEALLIRQLYNIHFEDILKVAEVQPIRKCIIIQGFQSNDIESLKKLHYDDDNDNDGYYGASGCKPTSDYQAFASKSVKLTDLTAQVICVRDLNEITQIKSLRTLTLFVTRIYDNVTYLNLGELSELKSLRIEFSDAIGFEDYIVVAILNSCRNLDRFSTKFDGHIDAHGTTMRRIHTLLKSVRDPALQGPLNVFIKYQFFYKNDTIRNTFEVLFNDAFLKVCYDDHFFYHKEIKGNLNPLGLFKKEQNSPDCPKKRGVSSLRTTEVKLLVFLSYIISLSFLFCLVLV